MDLARLKLETALAHRLAEESLPIMAPDLDARMYVEVLYKLYGFVRGWEIWAEGTDCSSFLDLLRSRQRSSLLDADLKYFATPPPSRFYAGPNLNKSERPDFLGAMYVIEGSTLGGQYIARHVEEVLNIQRGCGDSYFRGYGDLTSKMWSDFRAVLAALPTQESESVIQAAKVVFKDFTEWMRQGTAS